MTRLKPVHSVLIGTLLISPLSRSAFFKTSCIFLVSLTTYVFYSEKGTLGSELFRATNYIVVTEAIDRAFLT